MPTSTTPALRPYPGRRLVLRAAAAGLLFPALPSRAREHPAGTVVLTVRGRGGPAEDSAATDFDMTMLEQMPQTSYATRAPWYAKPRRFTGPLLRDVLAAAGAEGSMLRLTALNDYRVDIPTEDAERYEVIVARLLDDKPMAVRDKGPLLIMYPFDARAELRSATYYGRAAWQLRSIDVR